MDFVASVLEMRKRCPLDNRLLKLLAFLDPPQCKQLQYSSLLQIAQQFPNVIKEEEIEHLKDEVEDFKLQAFEDVFLRQDPYIFWNSVSKFLGTYVTVCYPVLQKLCSFYRMVMQTLSVFLVRLT